MSCSLCGSVCSCVSDSGPVSGHADETSSFGERADTSAIKAPKEEAYVPLARSSQPALLPEADASSWRKEVSERLHRYHARRRPRAPRYPSLRLKFELPAASWASSAPESAPAAASAQPVAQPSPAIRQAVARNYVEPAPEMEQTEAQDTALAAEAGRRETTAKIIEFPRSAYAPPIRLYELAEPILDCPRILEAPEVVPPPPALGGMTIEEAAKAEPERRPGIDMPLRSAPVERRLRAVAIDAAVVLFAAGLFAGLFFRIAKAIPTMSQLAATGAVLLGLFWFAYQYLLVVYSGTTPGLRALKLQVRRFDANPASRGLRRARILCAMLSAASLGMGYAWHFLDEDGLCWHERVTKTHIASEKQ